MPRKKATDQKLDRIADVAAPTGALEWVAQPAWFIGGADIIAPVGDGPRGDDLAAMAKVTRTQYLAAVKDAVAAGDLSQDYADPGIADLSWSRFVLYREGDHGPHHCHCSAACLAKHPKDPPRPAVEPAGEAYGGEGGPRQRRDMEAERTHDDERELERQRLLRIANEAGPRWFTT